MHAPHAPRVARALGALLLVLLACAASPALARGGVSSSRLAPLVSDDVRARLARGTSGAATVDPAAAAYAAADVDDEDADDEDADDVDVDGAHMDRRVLVDSPLRPWLQPTTFLRVALLIIRNAALDNPTAGFLQSILTTELAYTAFTNVFASFAAAVVQDFSQGVSNEGAVASEWVVDGETALENVLASEFVYGGAWGFEQFYGVGFEISGDAAAAIQQSLQPTWIPTNLDELDRSSAGGNGAAPAPGPAGADDAANASTNETTSATRRRKLQGTSTRRAPTPHPGIDASRRRLLSDEEAKARNLPKGAQLIAQVRTPLPREKTKSQIAAASSLGNERRRRRLLQTTTNDTATETATGDDAASAPTAGEEGRDPANGDVTGEDVGDITANWFDSFPAALPTAIRDRLIAQLEEFQVNPQIAISLEIAIAFVGVVEPGVGIVSAEAADETTITYDVVFNGYDAAIDVAATGERGFGVAGSGSAGAAVATAINDASEIIDAVTDILDEVNANAAADLTRVSAQGGPSNATTNATTNPNVTTAMGAPVIIPAHTNAETGRNPRISATRYTNMGKRPTRGPNATAPLRVSAYSGPTDASAPGAAPGPAAGRFGPYDPDAEYDYFESGPYDYEPFGAVSGTYAVAVSLIFLEQISLNGGSITII